MAFEIPHHLIQELRISLRREAGLSSYNPEDTSLPGLPPFDDAISHLDPSPDYLRCKHCKGKHLRGINSLICVFCGRKPNAELPPDPIKFTSTSACRCFLRSLHLDGSELVEPDVEGEGSSKGRNASGNEVPLLEFLDLEIRWPAESEKSETSVSGVKLSPLNLAGVDPDNFFEAKDDSVVLSSEDQFALDRQNNYVGSNASLGHGSLSLFQNVQPSETVSRVKEAESGGNSSAWEAEFQFAEPGTDHQESNSFDAFVGSSSVDLSVHMDSVFGPQKDLFEGKAKENPASASASASGMNDWFAGDIWSKPTAAVTDQSEQFGIPHNGNDSETKGKINNPSFEQAGWIQDSEWQTTSNSTAAADSKTITEDDESFGAWNDFTSSAPLSSTVTQGVHTKAPSAEKTSDISFFNEADNPQDVTSGTISESDFFSGTCNYQNGSAEMNIIQPETSPPDGMAARHGGSGEEAEVVLNFSNGSSRSKADDDVDKFMSQMHDLSFMLESSLSLPQKKEMFGSFSKD